MAEIDNHRLDVIIALLARLVAAASEGDEVLELSSAGLSPSEIAKVLSVSPNSVSKKIARAKGNKK